MRKISKKLIGFLLTAAMTLSFAVTVNAVENETDEQHNHVHEYVIHEEDSNTLTHNDVSIQPFAVCPPCTYVATGGTISEWGGSGFHPYIKGYLNGQPVYGECSYGTYYLYKNTKCSYCGSAGPRVSAGTNTTHMSCGA